MLIKFQKRKKRNFLIIGINKTSNNYFKKIIKKYSSAEIGFTFVHESFGDKKEQNTILIPVIQIVSALSWVFGFKRKTSYRLVIGLHIYYFILYILNKIYKYDGIFLYGDRHMFVEPAAIKLSKKCGIKSYVISIARSSGINEFFNKLDQMDNHERVSYEVSNMLENCYGNYICEIKTKKIFSFFPVSALDALIKFKFFTINPWINGAGLSDYTLVDRSIEVKRLKYYGFPKKKLLHTSKILDKSIEELPELGFKREVKKKKVCIVAPVYYEHGLAEYSHILNILNVLIKTATQEFDEVIVSLHPKMDKANYGVLENLCCKVIYGGIFSLVETMDAFLVPAGSSIYADVLEKGIPCLVYNPLKLKFDIDYSQFAKMNMKYSEDINDFSGIICKLKDMEILKNGQDIENIENYLKKIFTE